MCVVAAGCGGGAATGDPHTVRGSFATLQDALRVGDTRTVCRLIMTLPQSSSLAAVKQSLPRLQRLTTARLDAQTRRCAGSLRLSDIAPLKRALVGARLEKVTPLNDDDLAEGQVGTHRLRLAFIKLHDVWRMVFAGS